MSKATYIGGPWEHYTDDEPGVHNPDIYVRAADWGDIAKIGGGQLRVRLANARLMAAAPDLLAACQAWAAYFDELDSAGCDPSDPLTVERRKFHGKRIAATRAAVAKALTPTPAP